MSVHIVCQKYSLASAVFIMYGNLNGPSFICTEFASLIWNDDTMEILILLQLRRIVQSSEVSALITCSTHSDSVILSCVVWTSLRPSSCYNSFKRFRDE